MPPGYSRPQKVIDAKTNAYNAGSNPTPAVIKGAHHLSEITGDIEWPTGVTAGKVVVDIIPRLDFPSNVDGQLVFKSDVAADSLTPPLALHFSYVGNAPYVRYRVVTTVSGGGTPTVTAWHNGYTNF